MTSYVNPDDGRSQPATRNAKTSASSLFARLDRKQRARAILWLTHIGALIPGVLLFLDFWYYRLGADPVRAAILRTGFTGLVLLLLSLAITPLKTLFDWKQLHPARKWLGLYGFFYLFAHLSIFFAIDYGFDLRLVLEDIVSGPYVIVGFVAFLLLIPLAVTSTKGWMRRLGKNWKRLHWLVYPIAMLAIWHFIWLSKDNTRPFIFAGILALLLFLRLKPVRRAVSGWRRGIQSWWRRRGAASA